MDRKKSRYGINLATITMHMYKLHYPNKQATSNATDVPLQQRSPSSLIYEIKHVNAGMVKRHSLSKINSNQYMSNTVCLP